MSEFGENYEERAQNAETAVAALRGENASLRAERADLIVRADEVQHHNRGLAVENDALRARVAELDSACKYHANNASKMGRSLESTEHDLGAAKQRVAELEGLLREAHGYVGDYCDDNEQRGFRTIAAATGELYSRIEAAIRGASASAGTGKT